MSQKQGKSDDEVNDDNKSKFQAGQSDRSQEPDPND